MPQHRSLWHSMRTWFVRPKTTSWIVKRDDAEMSDQSTRGADESSIGKELLEDLAGELLRESSRVPEVLYGSEHSRKDRVAQYILAQGVHDPHPFQLPEPILHPIANPSVLVVGFNPNYGPDEDIPRYGYNLDEYIAFYADRFAPHRRNAQGRPAGKRLSTDEIYDIPHYHLIEQMIAEVMGTSTAFGLNAIYCDAIPWKWKQGRISGIRTADAEIAYVRLEKIVLTLKPKVVLSLGERPSRIVGLWTKSDPRPGRPHGDWPVLHVASYHPAAWGKMYTAAHKRAVQEALCEALSK